jgi:hypothetical protein
MTLSVREAHEAMKKGELTPLALAHAYLEHAKTENARIHAYLEFFDDIKEQAAHAAKLFKEGKESLIILNLLARSPGSNLSKCCHVPRFFSVKPLISITGIDNPLICLL